MDNKYEKLAYFMKKLQITENNQRSMNLLFLAGGIDLKTEFGFTLMNKRVYSAEFFELLKTKRENLLAMSLSDEDKYDFEKTQIEQIKNMVKNAPQDISEDKWIDLLATTLFVHMVDHNKYVKTIEYQKQTPFYLEACTALEHSYLDYVAVHEDNCNECIHEPLCSDLLMNIPLKKVDDKNSCKYYQPSFDEFEDMWGW